MISILGAFAVGIAVGVIAAVPVCILLFAGCNLAGRWLNRERGT